MFLGLGFEKVCLRIPARAVGIGRGDSGGGDFHRYHTDYFGGRGRVDES